MRVGSMISATALAVTFWAAAVGAEPDKAPPVPNFDKSDPVKYGTALAQYNEDRDEGWTDSYAQTTVTHTSARGESIVRKTRQMMIEGADGDKSMLRFLMPADVRGVAVLNYAHPKSADDSWLYLPANRRTRRISGSNRAASFLGTEFTYEDISRIFADRFRWKFLQDDTLEVEGQKVPVYQLEAIPVYESGYSKLWISLNRDQWRVERTVFFDPSGKKLKTLVYGRWKQFHGRRWRAGWMEMTNHQSQAKTSIELEPLLLNIALHTGKDGAPRQKLGEEQFTKRALEGN